MTAKILIVDDAKTNRMILRALLEKDYYTILEAEDGVEAIEVAKKEQPDLILLDYVMPIIDGLETCKRLKNAPQTVNIPVIIVTSSEENREKNETLAAGADDFLTKPIDQDVLFARVRNLLRVKALTDEMHMRNQDVSDIEAETIRYDEFDQKDHRLLLAASSDQDARSWKAKISPLFKQEITMCSKEDKTIELINSGEFDALIVAENLADGGLGMRLIANLRATWEHRDLAILFVAQSGTKAGLRSLEFGANDYLLEPFDPVELITRLRTQSRRIWLAKNLRDRFNKQLRLSVIDPLTELHNRRYLDDYLPRIIKRAERDQTHVALMIMDLDHFKALNDGYGHDFGDQVLVEFARRARESLRAVDMIVRYGGEEFVIITPGVNRSEAESISERLRKLVGSTPFETAMGQEVTVTTSVGVTMIEPGENDIKAIFKRADQALYEAKEHGRNQVNFAA